MPNGDSPSIGSIHHGVLPSKWGNRPHRGRRTHRPTSTGYDSRDTSRESADRVGCHNLIDDTSNTHQYLPVFPGWNRHVQPYNSVPTVGFAAYYCTTRFQRLWHTAFPTLRMLGGDRHCRPSSAYSSLQSGLGRGILASTSDRQASSKVRSSVVRSGRSEDKSFLSPGSVSRS